MTYNDDGSWIDRDEAALDARKQAAEEEHAKGESDRDRRRWSGLKTLGKANGGGGGIARDGARVLPSRGPTGPGGRSPEISVDVRGLSVEELRQLRSALAGALAALPLGSRPCQLVGRLSRLTRNELERRRRGLWQTEPPKAA